MIVPLASRTSAPFRQTDPLCSRSVLECEDASVLNSMSCTRLGGLAATFMVLLLGACGGSGDDAGSGGTVVAAVVGSDIDVAVAAEGALPAVSPSTARLSLENGRTLEFSIECELAPQMIESTEVLYLVTSPDTPSIIVRQEGEGGRGEGSASIRVEDADSKAIWESGSIYVNSGGSAALSRDGDTIIGVGGFFADADFGSAPVLGTLTAQC